MRAARLARRSCLEVRRNGVAPYLLPMQLSEPTQSARPDESCGLASTFVQSQRQVAQVLLLPAKLE